MENKAGMTAHLFPTWFTEYFNSITEIYWSEEKIPFKTWLFIDNAPDHPVALREKYHEIRSCFHTCQHNTHSAAHELGAILTFKPYYLRHTFHKAIATIKSGSLWRIWASQLKTSWKWFTILNTTEEHSWFIGLGQNTNINRSLEEVLIPALMEDFEELKVSVEEIAAETARELSLGRWGRSCDWTAQSHD